MYLAIKIHTLLQTVVSCKIFYLKNLQIKNNNTDNIITAERLKSKKHFILGAFFTIFNHTSLKNGNHGSWPAADSKAAALDSKDTDISPQEMLMAKISSVILFHGCLCHSVYADCIRRHLFTSVVSSCTILRT